MRVSDYCECEQKYSITVYSPRSATFIHTNAEREKIYSHKTVEKYKCKRWKIYGSSCKKINSQNLEAA